MRGSVELYCKIDLVYPVFIKEQCTYREPLAGDIVREIRTMIRLCIRNHYESIITMNV